LSLLKEEERKGLPQLLSLLKERRLGGLEKLYVTWKALQLRREYQALFTKGEYIPIYSDNSHAIIAYARRYHDQWCLVVAPLLAACRHGEDEVRPRIPLPAGAPTQWRNVFTSEEIAVKEGKLPLDILDSFPVALLMSE
jgi:(1->4)-alpha-D-glucan 1-alpha-D-glucosylmutase